MLRGGIAKYRRQAYLYNNIGAKSGKIKIIREQYDAFLAEDKKRKERNEYILERLDKMRCSDSLVPYRPKVQFANNNYQPQIYNRYGYVIQTIQPITEHRVPQPQMVGHTNPLELPVNNVEESKVLEELCKKFILIPKIQPPDEDHVVTKKSFKPSTTIENDSDWKSKYEILNQLKQNEKEDLAPAVKSKPSTANQLEQPSHRIPTETLNSRESYSSVEDEEPVRDNNETAIKQLGVDSRIETQCNMPENFNSASLGEVYQLNKVHNSEIKELRNSTSVADTVCASENSENAHHDYDDDIAESTYIQADSSTEQNINSENREKSDENVLVNSNVVPMDDHISNNFANDNGSFLKENHQFEAEPIQEQSHPETEIYDTDTVNYEQNQTYQKPQAYCSQAESNDQLSEYTVEATANYTNENYQYDNQTQELYDPSLQPEQEYQGYSAENQEYNNLEQYNEIDNANYTTNENSNGQYHLQPENTSTNNFAESENPVINAAAVDQIPTYAEKQENIEEGILDVPANPEFEQGIQDFETEQTELFTDNSVPVDENYPEESPQLVPTQEYNSVYEPTSEDTLDAHDYDATLQKYDQTYEQQYVGEYPDQSAIGQNEQATVEPVQEQQYEYQQDYTENVLEDKQQLNQDYAINENTVQDTAVTNNLQPNILQPSNEANRVM